jgi:hypothetical protein
MRQSLCTFVPVKLGSDTACLSVMYAVVRNSSRARLLHALCVCTSKAGSMRQSLCFCTSKAG